MNWHAQNFNREEFTKQWFKLLDNMPARMGGDKHTLRYMILIELFEHLTIPQLMQFIKDDVVKGYYPGMVKLWLSLQGWDIEDKDEILKAMRGYFQYQQPEKLINSLLIHLNKSKDNNIPKKSYISRPGILIWLKTYFSDTYPIIKKELRTVNDIGTLFYNVGKSLKSTDPVKPVVAQQGSDHSVSGIKWSSTEADLREGEKLSKVPNKFGIFVPFETTRNTSPPSSPNIGLRK